MNINFNVVIPARYASTRLPGKPLLEIAGKPMVILVVEQAKKSGAKVVVVATDDQRIYDAVVQHGHEALMTKTHHQSGTDRIAEVVNLLAWEEDEIVVNVQGDEPLIEPEIIQQVAEKLSIDHSAVMSTACFPMTSKDDFLNPNIVKVVFNKAFQAMYFSRAPIPYPRNTFSLLANSEEITMNAYRHIGIYAYRANFLKKYLVIPPSSLEDIESLEQLRVLQEGYKIAVNVCKSQPVMGVDTQEDLERVRKHVQTLMHGQ